MSRLFSDNSYYFITVPTTHHTKFFNTFEKKSIILSRLSEIQSSFQLSDFDFSIISNHYHLISYFKVGNTIPKILKLINGGSAYSLNKMTSNKKPVWGEYHIYLIKNDELLAKIRGYVVGNPLKHKEVKTLIELENYPFSSYQSLIKRLDKITVDEYIKSVISLDYEAIIKPT
ncbi:MAG: transposase [bacterium]